MANIALTSPLPGGSQTGFTSPTFTLSDDQSPDNNGLQMFVSALGGTQPAAVDAHSIARPFTISYWRPKVYKFLGGLLSNGQLSSVPVNTRKWIVRKGVTVMDGQPPRVASCNVAFNIPAGSEEADPDNLRAMISVLVGSLNDYSDTLGDNTITGTIG